MIARTWTGWTAAENADAYQAYMADVALDGYAAIPGNRAVLMLRRPTTDGRAEFTMITLWDSIEAVQRFAGADPTQAVFYPRDDELLVDRQRMVTHHDVYACHLPVDGSHSAHEEYEPEPDHLT